jgi:hypothetical protein
MLRKDVPTESPLPTRNSTRRPASVFGQSGSTLCPAHAHLSPFLLKLPEPEVHHRRHHLLLRLSRTRLSCSTRPSLRSRSARRRQRRSDLLPNVDKRLREEGRADQDDEQRSPYAYESGSRRVSEGAFGGTERALNEGDNLPSRTETVLAPARLPHHLYSNDVRTSRSSVAPTRSSQHLCLDSLCLSPF